MQTAKEMEQNQGWPEHCIYGEYQFGIFGRAITKYTVIYGVHTQFWSWPTLKQCKQGTAHCLFDADRCAFRALTAIACTASDHTCATIRVHYKHSACILHAMHRLFATHAACQHKGCVQAHRLRASTRAACKHIGCVRRTLRTST
jgi:hypothetical protein